MPHLFITGTDTGVGKTLFTCWLVRAWRARGHHAVALKPISTGDRHDAGLLREVSGNLLSLGEINPVHFREPASPLIAARAEKREIDFAIVNSDIRTFQSVYSHLAVEGIGGWRVPLAPNYDVRAWARDLALPVVVVARNALGTVNHTLLTVDSIRDAGLTCAGIILNAGSEEEISSPDFDLSRRTHLDLLHDLTLLPVFNFDRRAQAAGEVPVWLGAEKI
jgi:dethiobiotin synthetase